MAGKSKTERVQSPAGSGSASVDALASRALTMVAERNAKLTAELDHDLAALLHDAAIHASANPVPDVIARMKQAGLPPEVIADIYIPFVARQMGDEWCHDELSFARVTIGTARLQSALRSLGDEWSSYDYGDESDGGNGLIVIVVQDSYHTLGAVVLSGQLRRMGLSVRLSMGPSPVELSAIFASREYDAALISANESETLDSLREIVELIRNSASKCPPIIVGGSIVDQEADLKASTGADLVTNDPFEALEHCGLTKQTRQANTQTERRS